jgi:hypothetical protein
MIFYEHNYANIKLVLRGAKKGGILQWGWAEFRDPQKIITKQRQNQFSFSLRQNLRN